MNIMIMFLGLGFILVALGFLFAGLDAKESHKDKLYHVPWFAFTVVMFAVSIWFIKIGIFR